MKPRLAKETYAKIYRLLEKVTPLQSDCGELCHELCCQSDGEDMGIYLLPGEEQLFDRTEDWLVWEEHQAEDYDFPPSWEGTIYYVRCIKACPREKRPIQCRTFPLAPHLTEKGTLVLIRETLQLPYQCPLLAKKIPLETAFVTSLFQAWTELIKDPLIFDLVEYDSIQRQQNYEIIYPDY